MGRGVSIASKGRIETADRRDSSSPFSDPAAFHHRGEIDDPIGFINYNPPVTAERIHPFAFLYQNFLSVLGVCRLVFYELVAVVCLAGVLGNIANGLFNDSSRLEAGWLFFYPVSGSIGLAVGAALVHEILLPQAGATSARNLLRVGGFTAINPVDPATPYHFLSTHPSYVLVDAFPLGVIIVIAAVRIHAHFAFDGAGIFEVVNSVVGLALAAGLPVFRLFSWYALGRRLPPEATRHAWAPILFFYLTVSVPVLAGLWLARADVIALIR